LIGEGVKERGSPEAEELNVNAEEEMTEDGADNGKDREWAHKGKSGDARCGMFARDGIPAESGTKAHEFDSSDKIGDTKIHSHQITSERRGVESI
jgi:hypothetical protein